MFRFRLPLVGLAILALLPLSTSMAIAASAPTAVLMDSIAPGLVRTNDGFGTATVLVPRSGYVTYLVRTDARLAGKKVQIWTNTGAGWKLTTTRQIEKDGSARYYARVTKRLALWAKYQGASPAAVSHGRIASLSADGTTTIRLGCDEVSTLGAGVRSIVSRSVSIRPRGTIRMIVCARPATGFTWSMASLDRFHLLRVGHTLQPIVRVAADTVGSETWSLRLTTEGTGRATLVYSQPWRGGEKAAWTLMLTVTSPQP